MSGAVAPTEADIYRVGMKLVRLAKAAGAQANHFECELSNGVFLVRVLATAESPPPAPKPKGGGNVEELKAEIRRRHSASR